jgi:nucleoside-diphosphate-sugar epimerase
MRVLIIGCGYIGLPLGAELVRQGHEVSGLRRSADAQHELKSAGLTPLQANITKPQELARFVPGYDWVVNCVSSSGGGVSEYRAVYREGTHNVLRWLAQRPPRRYVYTSSTSVYGQNDGTRVDETSPTEPEAETARILVETEKLLLEAEGFPATILRVAGIYGPGRGYWLKQFLNNEAKLEDKGDRFTNMVHREDVVRGIIATLERGRAQQIYNLVDDEPVSQLEFFRWLSNFTGREMPPVSDSAPTRKRGITNKKVSNRKLKSELSYQFLYPTFREGCANLLRTTSSDSPDSAKS